MAQQNQNNVKLNAKISSMISNYLMSHGLINSKERDDMLSQNADLASKFLDNFERNASNEADKFMGDLETEMDNRFNHQDKLLGNMSQFITRFQQTLKIFGKDV